MFARLYPRISQDAEGSGAADHRRTLLAGLKGRVIEIGAGHGLNFSHYPPAVSQVVAVEPEPHLRGLAVKAAVGGSVPIEVRDGTAESLPAQDGEFDAAVVSLVLCSVSDQQAALREIARAMRPDGELRFYEHVVSHRPRTARIQRALDATVYPFLAGGCHCARDTSAAIREAGFQVQREERFAFKGSRLAPAVAHILGTARRP